jgi:hypothetical protein
MSGILQWRTDQHGVVMEPFVHDARLVEVTYRETTLKIGVGGQCDIMFILEGVQETNLCVWSGSIISDIIIRRLVGLGDGDEEGFDRLWKPLFDRQLFDRDIRSAAQRITRRNPNSFLFVLECSYGGTIACVADKIGVEEQELR